MEILTRILTWLSLTIYTITHILGIATSLSLLYEIAYNWEIDVSKTITLGIIVIITQIIRKNNKEILDENN